MIDTPQITQTVVQLAAVIRLTIPASRSRPSWGRPSARSWPPSPHKALDPPAQCSRIISRWTQAFLISRSACRSPSPSRPWAA